MYTSVVYNEVVGLHVHNQQEYKLVEDHEFLDCLGWQWSFACHGVAHWIDEGGGSLCGVCRFQRQVVVV